ncbi:hypothetical protein [Candidatus Poriferisodalis sp.]|uniref:hypothetical protein n=1 Tax=Candidatus Poriferisodalis sp. TaxID=3101277 RepID=UPI003B018661
MYSRFKPDKMIKHSWTRHAMQGTAAALFAAASILALAVPAAHAASCDFTGGYTDRYSWTRDEGDSCSAIGTDALVFDADIGEFVWFGTKWSNSWYVKLTPGTTVHNYHSVGWLNG